MNFFWHHHFVLLTFLYSIKCSVDYCLQMKNKTSSWSMIEIQLKLAQLLAKISILYDNHLQFFIECIVRNYLLLLFWLSSALGLFYDFQNFSDLNSGILCAIYILTWCTIQIQFNLCNIYTHMCTILECLMLLLCNSIGT